MEFLNEFLQNFNNDQIFMAFNLLLFLTLLGTVPSNSDLTIIGGSILTAMGKFEFIDFYITVLVLVIVSENIMFLLGQKFGDRLVSSKFIKSKISDEKRIKLNDYAKNNPFKLIFAIRMTPFLRPLFYFMIGSFRMPVKLFIKNHIPLLLIYVSVLIIFTYNFSSWVEKSFSDYKLFVLAISLGIWFLMFKRISRSLKLS